VSGGGRPVDNSGYELAAAGVELLLDVELEPFDEPELEELEFDESDDEDEGVEALTDSVLFDSLVELLEVFAASRLSLR
jgi:hypothetical protein